MKVKSLLIVYKEKDEEYFKHLKALIDSKDDSKEGMVGVEDGTVRVFKCPEKQWMKYKAKGKENRLADKTLFIDDMKGITIPGPIEPVYNQYGISYGPIDKQHYVVEVDEKFVWNEDIYKRFQEELKQLTDKEGVAETDAFGEQEGAKERIKKNGGLVALSLLFPPALFIAGGMVVKDASEAIKNAKALRSQMLYFALSKVYLEELDAFMKS